MERFPPERLTAFAIEVLKRLGVPGEDAECTASALVAADLRGLDSHGVARLPRYVEEIQKGIILPRARREVVKETEATVLLDGGDGLGPPTAVEAMDRALEKAEGVGAGFCAVRRSNHFGMASFYALRAVEREMIGIAMTNTAPLVVPTFGRDAVIGTNPICFAAPAKEEPPLVLDIATSVVSRGKVEAYHREGKPLPWGWAVDETGHGTQDAGRVLDNLKKRAGGGLLPLGGEGTLLGGHKGFGLALMVDVLCGVLPGAAYADLVDRGGPTGIGHFLGAIRIDVFRHLEEFLADMDDFIRRIRGSRPAEGAGRIYLPGEMEWETEQERRKQGIPLHPKVIEALQGLGRTFGVAL